MVGVVKWYEKQNQQVFLIKETNSLLNGFIDKWTVKISLKPNISQIFSNIFLNQGMFGFMEYEL